MLLAFAVTTVLVAKANTCLRLVIGRDNMILGDILQCLLRENKTENNCHDRLSCEGRFFIIRKEVWCLGCMVAAFARGGDPGLETVS